MRTSSQNINLRSFNGYVTISTFLMWQGCGSSSKMTLVETALNLGEKLKIYPQVLTFFIKLQIWSFHVVVLLTTAKKWTKIKNARAGRAKPLFLPTKYANLWRCRCRRRCRCLSSLIVNSKQINNSGYNLSLYLYMLIAVTLTSLVPTACSRLTL